MTRRLPALILVVAAFVALVVTTRDTTEAETATFSVSASGWMPSAPAATGLTETWFCPGVPASGGDVEGEVVIANRGGDQLAGTVLLINDRDETRRLDLTIDGWASARVDLDGSLPGEMVAAVVEVEGGGAVVEQFAIGPGGDSVAPCANATSDSWYLADGFTVDGSLDQIVLTNPFDQTVVANLEFATREGSRSPAAYRGLTVGPRSVRVIDLGAPGAGAQGEPILAVKVEAARGRLVVGRSQRFDGGDRDGTQVTLASPALRNQWWFSGGEKGSGIDERYSIYNPTDDPVEVDVLFVGISTPIILDPIVVPAHQVVTFDPGPVADLPEGRHATVFATLAEPSIVVERASTYTIDDITATSVISGATARQDSYVASTWYLASGPPEPVTDALVLYNADNTAGTVSVSAVGTSGPVPVPGLQDVALPAASIVTLDLTDPLVIDRQLIVEATSRIFVERSYPTGRGATRTSSWAIPSG